MITKQELLKKLERFSSDTEFELVNCGDKICLIMLESGEVIYFTNEDILDFKCPNNSMICNQGYACDACPYNEDLKDERNN